MKYLTIKELSAKLGGRSRSTIYRDVKARYLPAPIKLGGRIYWIESDIDQFMRGEITLEELAILKKDRCCDD